MIDERMLLPRLQALEEEALEVVYDAFQPPLYRYAYRLLGSADDAEEAVAETFHRLLQALDRGQGPERHLQAWLYRVLHNLIVDRYRERPAWLPDPGESDPVVDGLDEEVQRRMVQERIRLALRQLTREQQQVVLLKYLEGLTNEEVARVLGKPVGAVKSLQHRALAALRRILEASSTSVHKSRSER